MCFDRADLSHRCIRCVPRTTVCVTALVPELMVIVRGSSIAQMTHGEEGCQHRICLHEPRGSQASAGESLSPCNIGIGIGIVSSCPIVLCCAVPCCAVLCRVRATPAMTMMRAHSRSASLTTRMVLLASTAWCSVDGGECVNKGIAACCKQAIYRPHIQVSRTGRLKGAPLGKIACMRSRRKACGVMVHPM